MMKNIFKKLFGIFAILAIVIITAQDVDIDEKNKLKKLVTGIKIGTTGANWPENVEEIVKKVQNELLTKADKPELTDFTVQSCIVSLESSLEEEVRGILKSFDLPDFIEKMPILGIKFAKAREERVLCFYLEHNINKDSPCLPYALLLDMELFSRVDDIGWVQQRFCLFHEIGHIKAMCSGLHLERDNGKELDEVVADIHSLTIWARMFAKEKREEGFNGILYIFHRMDNPYPYLNRWELVYYAEQLQQKDGNVDVLSYAQKIVAERKKDGYEQKIERSAKKLIESFNF